MELTLISGIVDMSVPPVRVKHSRGAEQIFIRVEFTNDYKSYTTISVALFGVNKTKFEKFVSNQNYKEGDTLGVNLQGHIRFSTTANRTFHYILASQIDLYNIDSIKQNSELNLLNHLYRKKKGNKK